MDGGFAVAVRALHYAATAALFGGFLFELIIAGALPAPVREPFPRRRLAWALAAALLSAALWLALEAVRMSGLPLRQALGADTLGAVAFDTRFGRLWLVRLGLAAGLAGVLACAGPRAEARGERRAIVLGSVLAAALLASLAGTGHAAAARGVDRYVHGLADGLHLLAAGAWLGALPPFALLLARARRAGGAGLAAAAMAARRFSALGVASVAVLVASGVVNAAYLVGGLPALAATGYGRLLAAKLVLFALMLALAAFNRLRLTPRLAGVGAGAARRGLLRHAVAEAALGAAVLAVVAVLGTTAPAHHHAPRGARLEAAADAHAMPASAPAQVAAFATVALAALAVVAGVRARR